MSKVALFGAGRIGSIHGRNLAMHLAFSLSRIVDPNAAAAANLAGKLGAKVAKAADAFADPTIDAVVIASSTDTHLDYCLVAAPVGKAVWCEKPLDLDLDRIEANLPQLMPLASRLLRGFKRRFDPNFRKLHARLATGEIDALESMHAFSRDPGPPRVDYIRVWGALEGRDNPRFRRGAPDVVRANHRGVRHGQQSGRRSRGRERG